MNSFLEHVAEDILRKYGTDLSRVTVVFPNKRAALFLNDHLARRAGRPIWSPSYMTISDLFLSNTTRTVADPLLLVSELHRSFVAQTGIDETLDHFFGWGQLLLSDFDDLDKHLADADKVLANLRDIHELDDISYLSEEQKAVIRQFFSNFSDDHNSQLKERFLSLWSHMADIYHDFNRRLSDLQTSYEGAIYKEVVRGMEEGKRMKDDGRGHSLFIFVGFNLLLPVEQRLFSLLQREGKARFYWDFDRYYMNEQNEAGHYISQYLSFFPNELDTQDDDIYDCFSRPKDITFISAPTENIQARYIRQWLQKTVVTEATETTEAAGKTDTAIVLCNEGLLQTVIHCLPDEVSKVNVTTGYPLVQSPVASLLVHLITLRTQGYEAGRDSYRLRQVNAVLRHPYVVCLSTLLPTLQKELTSRHVYHPTSRQLMGDEGLTLLFRPFDDTEQLVPQLLRWLCDVVQAVASHSSLPMEGESCDKVATNGTGEEDILQHESLFRAYTLLNRLLSLVDGGHLTVDVITLQRLIQQLIQYTTIPFEGEPVEGLQIMGMLETRCLDFRHLLILSCNEGNMPHGVNDTSFIPYNIRKAYGLTTIDHKVALQSYYFHRLLQRAEDVTVVYNNATTDGQRGEMSRFLLQLMVECPHHIELRTLRAGQRHIPFLPPTVEKTQEVMEKLWQRFAAKAGRTNGVNGQPLMTPTAVNRYLRCPLQFYYHYVCGLREPDETEDDVIDNRLFGNIFHEASRIIYSRLMEQSRQILAKDIDSLLRQRVDIERAVDQAIQQELFRSSTGHMPQLNGLQLINREVIITYIRQLLKLDRRLAPFTILGLECDVTSDLTIEGCHESRSPREVIGVTIGGRIDRLDQVTDSDGRQRIRVVDYKTGAKPLKKALADVEAIFQQESLAQHSDYYLQTFLYACLVRTEHPDTPVSPALLFIQHAGGDDYDPTLCFGREPIRDVADTSLRFMELLQQILHEIFAADVPFTPTADRDRCSTCPYKNLCALSSLSCTSVPSAP